MATGNQRYMKILTNQFASNEEQPIFSDLEGIRLNGYYRYILVACGSGRHAFVKMAQIQLSIIAEC